MVKAVVKSTNTLRFERLEDVEAFHEQLKQECAKNDYDLVDFKYSVKIIKEKGEPVGEYFIVVYSILLDDVKDPGYAYNSVQFVHETKED